MHPGEAAECERILRGLPEWFGIEEALVQYLRDVAAMDTRVLEDADGDEGILGFVTVRRPNEASAELQVMAVHREHRGRGIGRALVADAERRLRAEGREFLQVKTLGPSRPNAEYAATRGFYRSVGFVPLEENRLWGDVNPCLILVKHLGGIAGEAARRVSAAAEEPANYLGAAADDPVARQCGEYEISTNRVRMDVDAIHAYLSQSYWAEGIPREVVARSVRGSLCFGVFHRGAQVGFARVVTDAATFAYLADVYILDAHRGRGLAKELMDAVMEHPKLQGLRRWSLVTRDAHGLYAKFAFTPLASPDGHMEILRRGIYSRDEGPTQGSPE